MTLIILLAVILLIVIAGGCLGLIIPLIVAVGAGYEAYQAGIAEEDNLRMKREKEDATIALATARKNKVLADHEVLESRRAKLDSEVAILELRIQKQRRDMGLDTHFTPDNY